MNLESLIEQFRVLAKDRSAPYLVETQDVVDWLNEAEAEAAIRKRLIRDDTTAEVCEIDLTVGTRKYALHPSVYEIINIRLLPGNGDETRDFTLRSREWLDANQPSWRTWHTTQRIPARIAIQDDTTITLAGFVELDDKLLIECYRTPLVPMEADDSEPEIHGMHHLKLVQWALHRAFSVPDNDLFDPQKSERAEQEFTKYFGLRPDADARRKTRIDVPHHNVSPLI